MWYNISGMLPCSDISISGVFKAKFCKQGKDKYWQNRAYL